MPSRNVWIAVAVIVIVVVAGVGVYYWWTLQQQPTPNKTLTLYEGDKSGGTQGVFGLTPTSMTSPGPQLNFTVGDVVKITVYNIANSSSSHNWAIVNAKSGTATVLFNAQIGSASSAIAPGSSGTVTFKVDTAGTFYYVCQVPGHVDLGMWGTVLVTAASGPGGY